MAVHPLRPATDRRLGGPLPRQQANQTRSHLSAHKALTSQGCPQEVSCGISSRFQLLSPTERQVLHALLTRSPLSNPRRSYPVRLACVRHAASVRPEPGSNSQKIVSKALSCLKSFSESLLLAINSRIFVGCFRLRFKQIHKFVKGVLFVFALFNLQGTVAFRSRGQLAYFSTVPPICQELFSSFFNFQSVPCHFSLPTGSFRILSQHC